MTLNQVAYWALKETERSNLAREQETNRHNLVYEVETERHNRATEQNQYLSAMAAQSSAAAAHRQASVAETREAHDYEINLMNARNNQYNAELRAQEISLDRAKHEHSVEVANTKLPYELDLMQNQSMKEASTSINQFASAWNNFTHGFTNVSNFVRDNVNIGSTIGSWFASAE